MNFALGVYAVAITLVVMATIASRHRQIAGPLMVGFVARQAFVFVDDLYWGLSRAGDGGGWDSWAQVWAARGLDEILANVQTGHDLYKACMALLYYFIGHSPLMVQVLNAFFGTLVILYVWKLARVMGADRGAAKRAAWIVALFPSTILHSGMLLREVAVTLPLTIGVYQLAAWHRFRRAKNAVYAAGALVVSMAFHSGAFAVILALTAWLAGSWVRALLLGRLQLVLRTSVALLVAGAVVAFAAGTGWGMEKFRHIDADDVSTLAQVQDYGTTGRTAYLEELRADSIGELILQSPIRVAYFLFAPFPWMIAGFRDVIGFADALVFFWLGWRLFRGRSILRQNKTALMVVALFAAMAFTFALGVSNYGTAFRHRSKMLPMLVAVALVVPVRRRARALPAAPVTSPGLPAQPGSLLHTISRRPYH